MRLHRFILRDPELIHQWRNVLRLRAGQKVVLADGQGQEVEATIKSVGKDQAELEEVRELPPKTIIKREVTLFCAILKADHFEWVAQKATELGVASIQPIITTRTVKTSLRLERLEKIIKEAAEQSGRTTLPSINEPTSFDNAIVMAGQHDLNYFLDPTAKNKIGTKPGQKVAVWIGPEGGWTNEELEVAGQFATLVSISPLTLRAETAAIIGTYLAITND